MKHQEKSSGPVEPGTSAVQSDGLPAEVRVPDALDPIDGERVAIRSGDPMAIRATWMRMQGLAEDEISEMCDPAVYPGNVADELENLRAAHELRRSDLTSDDLEAMSQKHRPPADWK
jgi:hypothetical protein